MTKKVSHRIWVVVMLVVVAGLVITAYIFVQNWPNYEQNSKIEQDAINQKNPNICDQIVGATQDTYSLPGPNGVQTVHATYNQNQSRARCKAQAKTGQNYVY